MLYERLDVYRRIGNTEVVIYRCWHILPKGGYIVQSADRVRIPFTPQQAVEHEARFLELFAETPPEERSEPFQTIAEAIENFDIEFGNMWD